MISSKDPVTVQRRWRRGILREVLFESNRSVVCKRFWAAPGVRRIDRSWRLEYRALSWLRGVVRSTPLSISEWYDKGGISAVFRRSFIEGHELKGAADLTVVELSKLLVSIHKRGVITHDVNIGNLLRCTDGTLEFVDFGKASCYASRGLWFLVDIGRELARVFRETLECDRESFATFCLDYRERSGQSRLAWAIIRFSCWISLSGRIIRGGGRSAKRAAEVAKQSIYCSPETDEILRPESLAIRRGGIQHGRYYIFSLRAESVEIENFIRLRAYNALSESSRLVTRNRRYSLWNCSIAGVHGNLMLKMAWTNPAYSSGRLFGLWFSQQFTNVASRAFKGAQLLTRAGIDTITPLSWWTRYESCFDKRHYLLYRHIEADGTAYSAINSMGPEDQASRAALVGALADVVRRLFTSGLRHDDLAIGNYLVRREGDAWRLWLIDTDSISRNRISHPAIKLFFDLRCLRRLNLHNSDREQFLRLVLAERDTPFWRRVLKFWINGGNKRPIRALIKALRNK